MELKELLDRGYITGEVVEFDQTQHVRWTELESKLPVDRALDNRYAVLDDFEWIVHENKRGSIHVCSGNNREEIISTLPTKQTSQIRSATNKGLQTQRVHTWFSKSDKIKADKMKEELDKEEVKQPDIEEALVGEVEDAPIVVNQSTALPYPAQEDKDEKSSDSFEQIKNFNEEAIDMAINQSPSSNPFFGGNVTQSQPPAFPGQPQATSGSIPVSSPSVEDLLAQAGVQSPNMTAFSGQQQIPVVPPASPPTPPVTVDKKRQEEIIQSKLGEIRDAVNSVRLEDNSAFWALFREVAEVKGYFTPGDKRVCFASVSKPLKGPDNKRVLKAGVPSQVTAAFYAGQPVAASNFQTVSTIVVKELKPSKISVVFCVIPAHLKGMSVHQYRNETATHSNYFQGKETVMEIFPFDDFCQKVVLCGGRIKENPRTHGDKESELTITVKSPKIQVKTSADGMLSYEPTNKFSIKPENRSSVLCDTNYLPQKVYQSMDINTTYDDDTLNLLNISAFERFFKGRTVTTTNTDSRSVYEKLSEDDRASLTWNGVLGTGMTIKSKWITNDATNKRSIRVVKFWANKHGEASLLPARDRVLLPIKTFSMPKKGDGDGRWVFITHDIFDESADRNLTSLNLPEFSAIVKELGSTLDDLQVLKDMVKRSSGSGKGGTSDLDPVTAAKLMIAGLDKKLFNNIQPEGYMTNTSLSKRKSKSTPASVAV
jgi:hypothetical protein